MARALAAISGGKELHLSTQARKCARYRQFMSYLQMDEDVVNQFMQLQKRCKPHVRAAQA